jgi:hypothetical protein
MKKNFYFIILALLPIISCTKTQTEPIIGKWLTVYALTSEFDERGVQVGSIQKREITLTDSLYQVVEFKSDGTRIVTKVLGDKYTSRYTINGNVILINESGKPEFEADYYFLNNQLFLLADKVATKSSGGTNYISKKVHCIYVSAY